MYKNSHRDSIEKYNNYKIPTPLGRIENTYLKLFRGEKQRKNKIPEQEFIEEKCM